MKSRNLLLLTALATAIAAGGCEQKKSSNPLSPSVAGPIPGVAITAPKLLEPEAGDTDRNGRTAGDAAGREREHQRSAAPDLPLRGGDGRRLLEQGPHRARTSSRAATAGPSSSCLSRWPRSGRITGASGPRTAPTPARSRRARSFSIYTPIVLQPPPLSSRRQRHAQLATETRPSSSATPVAAARSARSSTSSRWRWTRGSARSCRLFEQAEQAGSIADGLGFDLGYDTRYFWRARAWEMTKNTPGPWSGTASFRTVLAPPPPPTPTPTPGGGGGHVHPGCR